MNRNPPAVQGLASEVERSSALEALFDRLSDTVFFTKDAAGRYVSVNQTLVRRLGQSRKHDVIGQTAAALFPPSLAARITAQDKAVIGEGQSIQGELELHLYPDGRQDWCLTWKEPLRAGDGRIIGLSGLSRDLKTLPGPQPDMKALSNALEHIRHNLDRPLLLADLAKRAALSTYQLDQRIRSLFGLSAGQYIARARIELACNRLRQTGTAISRVALDCGYADQAAFARQFKKYVGLTPKAYRDEALSMAKHGR